MIKDEINSAGLLTNLSQGIFRRQSHGESGRDGGHGGFPGHRVAGFCAQGSGARQPRGKIASAG